MKTSPCHLVFVMITLTTTTTTQPTAAFTYDRFFANAALTAGSGVVEEGRTLEYTHPAGIHSSMPPSPLRLPSPQYSQTLVCQRNGHEGTQPINLHQPPPFVAVSPHNTSDPNPAHPWSKTERNAEIIPPSKSLDSTIANATHSLPPCPQRPWTRAPVSDENGQTRYHPPFLPQTYRYTVPTTTVTETPTLFTFQRHTTQTSFARPVGRSVACLYASTGSSLLAKDRQ